MNIIYCDTSLVNCCRNQRHQALPGERRSEPQVSIIFHILISALLVLEDSVIGLTILVSSTDIYQGHVQGFVLVGATGDGEQHCGQI